MGCGQTKSTRNESLDIVNFCNNKQNQNSRLTISPNFETKKAYDISKNPITKRRLQKAQQSQTNSYAEISVYQK